MANKNASKSPEKRKPTEYASTGKGINVTFHLTDMEVMLYLRSERVPAIHNTPEFERLSGKIIQGIRNSIVKGLQPTPLSRGVNEAIREQCQKKMHPSL